MAHRGLSAIAVRFGAVGLIAAASVAASQAHAGVTTFGEFSEQATGTGHTNIQFAQTGSTGALSTYSAGGDPVYFTYTQDFGLPAGLQGPLGAKLNITATTTLPASVQNVPGLGSLTIQPFNSISLAFTLPTDFIYNGVNYGDNLLTMTVTPTNGNPVAFMGSTGTTTAVAALDSNLVDVVYTSSFLDFTNATGNDAALSLSSVLPSFSLGNGQDFVNAFTGDMTGTFDSDPPTGALPVSEPVSAALLGLGLVGLGIARRHYLG